MKTLILILISFNSLAQDNILCENGSCNYDPDLTIQNDSDGASYTEFEIDSPTDAITISSTVGESPRDVRFSINQNTLEGQDLSINLSSFKSYNDSGEVVVFASAIDNLNIVLNGNNGSDSPTAAKLCAQKVLNGDFGTDVTTIFNNNRIADPTLPLDECVAKDLEDVRDQKFSCDGAFSEVATSNLTATRWEKRKQCEGLAQRKMCVKKTMDVTCRWLGEKITSTAGLCCDGSDPSVGEKKPLGGGVSGVGDWQCNPSLCDTEHSGWNISFPTYRLDESYVTLRRDSGMSDENICDELTGRDTFYLDSFSNIRSSKIVNKSGSTIYSGTSNFFFDSDDRRAIRIYDGYWYGLTSNGKLMSSDKFQTITPSNLRFITAEGFRSCYLAGSEFDSHLNSLMNSYSCEAGSISNNEYLNYYFNSSGTLISVGTGALNADSSNYSGNKNYSQIVAGTFDLEDNYNYANIGDAVGGQAYTVVNTISSDETEIDSIVKVRINSNGNYVVLLKKFVTGIQQFKVIQTDQLLIDGTMNAFDSNGECRYRILGQTVCEYYRRDTTYDYYLPGNWNTTLPAKFHSLIDRTHQKGHYAWVDCDKSGNNYQCKIDYWQDRYSDMYKNFITSEFGYFNPEATSFSWETKGLYQAPNGRLIRLYVKKGVGTY